MIVNDAELLRRAPIRAMLHLKHQYNGVSYGLSEAGYDIRIKQDVYFWAEKPADSFDHIHCEEVMVVEEEKQTYYANSNFCLASTIEQFDMPTSLVGIVHDKSTWARQGLSVFNTVVEPGWNGFLTLELVYHGRKDLHIPAGSGIAQVIFHEVTNPTNYIGKYQDQANQPVGSIFI